MFWKIGGKTPQGRSYLVSFDGWASIVTGFLEFTGDTWCMLQCLCERIHTVDTIATINLAICVFFQYYWQYPAYSLTPFCSFNNTCWRSFLTDTLFNFIFKLFCFPRIFFLMFYTLPSYTLFQFPIAVNKWPQIIMAWNKNNYFIVISHGSRGDWTQPGGLVPGLLCSCRPVAVAGTGDILNIPPSCIWPVVLTFNWGLGPVAWGL